MRIDRLPFAFADEPNGLLRFHPFASNPLQVGVLRSLKSENQVQGILRMRQQTTSEGRLFLLGGDNLRFLIEEPMQAQFRHLRMVSLEGGCDLDAEVEEAVLKRLPASLVVNAGTYADTVLAWMISQRCRCSWLSIVIVGQPNVMLPSIGCLPELVERVVALQYPFAQKAVLDAIGKSVWWSQNLCRMMERVQYFAELSERELAIVSMATDGVPNKSMARRLEVSIKTIEKNRRSAYEKLNISSSAEMAALVTFRRYLNRPYSHEGFETSRMFNQSVQIYESVPRN